MLQIVPVPQSMVLNYVVLITVQLKWAWDYLLYQSFFHPHSASVGLSDEYPDSFDVTRYDSGNPDQFGESEECAVCLCKIDEDDEVRELRCSHLFHSACLDRWQGCGHVTCPLCRSNLRLPPLVAELHHELIVINFSAAGRYNDRCAWWLR